MLMLHVHDGRILTLDYNTLGVQEVIEFDEHWDKDSEPTRKFEIHDRYDSFYFLQENYEGNCRSKAETTVSHGYVLMCGGEVITRLDSEQQGKDIVAEIAHAIDANERIVFLDETLIVKRYTWGEREARVESTDS